MPIKPEDVTWVEEPDYGLLDAMYLPAIAEGLRTTVRHLFKPDTITEQYPEEKPDLPPNYRGVHRLNRDDQGRVKCVACFLCATACPARCIEIVGDKAPWADRDKYPTKFVIDELMKEGQSAKVQQALNELPEKIVHVALKRFCYILAFMALAFLILWVLSDGL